MSNIDEVVRKIAAHQNTTSDLNTFTDTCPDNIHMMFVMTFTRCCVLNTSKSGDELIGMKETCGLCERRPEQHYNISRESDMNHVRIWLVSSAPDSATGRVWTAHTAIKSRGCQRGPLLSAFWLVDDSNAVSLRCLWTRDRTMRFRRIFQVVLLLSHPAYSVSQGYMCTHGDPLISSHGSLKTSSHLAVHIHVSPILTRLCCGRTSEVVPILPFSLSPEWPRLRYDHRQIHMHDSGISGLGQLPDVQNCHEKKGETPPKKRKHTPKKG